MVLKSFSGWALVICMLASATGKVWADPKEAHKLGIEALEAGRWADAERWFRAAIAERPQEKVNRLFKTAYLPHYFLGVALAELSQCRAALDCWAESSQQGQIEKSDLTDELERRRSDCQNHLRQAGVARSDVEQLLLQAGTASASVSNLSATQQLAPRWDQGDPSFATRQKSAEKKLADAQERLADMTAAGELQRLGAARSSAESALAELNAVLTDARRRLGALSAATASALEQLEVLETSARNALRSISDLSPYPRRLGQRVAAVDRILNEIRDGKLGSSAEKLSEMSDQLTKSLSALERAARRPPEQLAQTVEAFLSGSYADALTLLDEPRLLDDAQSKPHVCLIRAASEHALWVLGGELDPTLRDLAIEAITTCAEGEAAEASSLTPDPRFFSPRFIAFRAATLEAYAQSTAPATADDADRAEATPSAGPAARGAGEEGQTRDDQPDLDHP